MLEGGERGDYEGWLEALASNQVLGGCIRDAIASVDKACVDAVQMVETREDVNVLLQLEEYIDLFIPRGSNDFVRYIQEHTRVPVLGMPRAYVTPMWIRGRPGTGRGKDCTDASAVSSSL